MRERRAAFRAASGVAGFEDRLGTGRLVERRLRTEADGARRRAPAHLHARTMANLDRGPRGEVAPAVGGRSVAYATAASLLLLVAVFAGTERSAPAPSRAAPLARADGGVMPVIEIDPAPLRSAIARRADRLGTPWSAPLVAEARLVMADAGRVADSVLARLPGRPVRLSRAALDDVDAIRPAASDGGRPRAFPWNRLELP